MVEDIDWSKQNELWSPPFSFNDLEWRLGLTVTSDTAQQTDPLDPAASTYPLTVQLVAYDVVESHTLTYCAFVKTDLDAPIVGGEQAPTNGFFNQTEEFICTVTEILDAVHFSNEDPPTKLLIGVMMYPAPIDTGGLVQIPVIRSSTWLHLEGELASAHAVRDNVPYRFNTWSDDEKGDIVVQLSDGVVKAHSLPRRYNYDSYFSAILSQPMQEQQSSTIKLNDINCALFKQILRFIYTGQTVIKDDEIFEFYNCTSNPLPTNQVAFELTPQAACQHLKDFLQYPDLNICQLMCLRIINAAGVEVEDTAEWKELVDTPGFAELQRQAFRLGRRSTRKRKREEGGEGRDERRDG
ncbi:hypothetical protein HDV00_001564 [Rhizophlyctis rosea]|nr:hypothetical protein HDV00_001564 [Rhizophlyctis rosea]